MLLTWIHEWGGRGPRQGVAELYNCVDDSSTKLWYFVFFFTITYKEVGQLCYDGIIVVKQDTANYGQ